MWNRHIRGYSHVSNSDYCPPPRSAQVLSPPHLTLNKGSAILLASSYSSQIHLSILIPLLSSQHSIPQQVPFLLLQEPHHPIFHLVSLPPVWPLPPHPPTCTPSDLPELHSPFKVPSGLLHCTGQSEISCIRLVMPYVTVRFLTFSSPPTLSVCIPLRPFIYSFY